MLFVAKIGVFLIAILHLYILVLEMFLWDKTAGKKTFGHNDEFAKTTKVLAMNQGLYNGFLSAGLFWSLLSVNFVALAYFFLGCVAVAGVFGAMTASRKIIFFQTVPALIVMGLVAIS
ncbi:DUF1304 domain-containing protein [Moraxella pluranimalium]|uniref:Epimerase n=1 Tax=Moraxella pluranimalium TaxID=470453 RepID=A0A1T0CR85_9GAMM|nr:DUF1304 domain-containing protein [Moraxella pluranimalium]OOS24856.1 hypothetical protein B0680_03520 [Moraxella pluranimalium]